MHDAMWAPWRLQYLQRLESEGRDNGGLDDFLTGCWESPEEDHDNHVLLRQNGGLIMLNRHPYASGHLLVALGEARPRLIDYSQAQRAAFWMLVERAWSLMYDALAPQGINMGVNEGAAAGAGLPGHLHAHLVPRWHGDVNFMSTLGGCRVIPSSLDAVRDVYLHHLAESGDARD